MKKLLCAMLGILLAVGLTAAPAQAKAGDIKGTVCWSDISARINGHSIAAYNWDGSMVVEAERLREYGFSVAFDWEKGTLHIDRDPAGEVTGSYTPPEDRPQSGSFAYYVLETDIVTYVQGEPVESANIDGTTMVRLRDLAPCGTVTWDPVHSVAELTLFEWEAGWTASDYQRDGSNAEAVFTWTQGQLEAECLESPFDDGYGGTPSFKVDRTGWSSSVYNGRYNVEETDSNWTKGWYALWLLAPAPWDDDFVRENSPELREQVAQYLNISLNGEPVPGVLWAMRGNGHIDLNFTFDRPLSLSEGDQLRVWLGMPKIM